MKTALPVLLLLLFLPLNIGLARLYKSDLVILAESAFAIPMKDIVKDYINKNYVNVIINFADYNDLTQHMAEADLLITSNPSAIKAFMKGKEIKGAKPSDIMRERIFLCVHKDSVLRAIQSPTQNLKETLKAMEQQGYLVAPGNGKTILGILVEKLIKDFGIERVLYVDSEQKVADLVSKGKTAGILSEKYLEHCCRGKLIKVLQIRQQGLGNINYRVISDGSDKANSFLKFLILNKGLLWPEEREG